MAHKTYLEEKPLPVRSRFPSLRGRIGFSLWFATYEVFIGVVISPVEIETITKRRTLSVPKGKVKTYVFDPLGE